MMRATQPIPELSNRTDMHVAMLRAFTLYLKLLTVLSPDDTRQRSHIAALCASFEGGSCVGFSMVMGLMHHLGKRKWWVQSLICMEQWAEQYPDAIDDILSDDKKVNALNDKLDQAVRISGAVSVTTLRQLFERAMNYVLIFQGGSPVLNPFHRREHNQDKTLHEETACVEFIDDNGQLRTISGKKSFGGFLGAMQKKASGNYERVMAELIPNDERLMLMAHNNTHSIWVGYHPRARNHKPWLFFNTNHQRQKKRDMIISFKTKHALVEEMINCLGLSLVLDIIGFESGFESSSLSYSQFIKQYQHLLHFLNGLHAMSYGAPEMMTEYLHMISNDREWQQKIAGLLASKDADQYTVIDNLAGYSPHAFEVLMQIAIHNQLIFDVLARELSSTHYIGVSVLFLVAYTAPTVFSHILKMASEHGFLFDVILPALLIADEKKWTALHGIANHSPCNLVALLRECSSHPDLHDDLLDCLIIPTSDGWTVLHFLAYRSDDEMLRLIELSAKHEKIIEIIADFLCMRTNDPWSGLQILAKSSPRSFAKIVELARTVPRLQEALTVSLKLSGVDGWTGLKLAATCCPQLLPALLEVTSVKDNVFEPRSRPSR